MYYHAIDLIYRVVHNNRIRILLNLKKFDNDDIADKIAAKGAFQNCL
jgi:hypothetical protein